MINEEEKAEGQLDSHVLGPSVIYEPAVPAATIAMAALAGRPSIETRATFAELLLFILSAEAQSIESARQSRNLIEECRSAALPGMWLLYSEVMAGERGDVAGYCFEVLSLLEDDEIRLEELREIAGDKLPWDLRNP